MTPLRLRPEVTPEDTPKDMSEELPIIVIVQGCFMTRDPYGDLTSCLASLHYTVVHPILPSCDNRFSLELPSLNLIDDALAVRLTLTHLIEYMGKAVVVVMHSYGGLVGCEAIPPDLSYATRRSQGLPGGVLHLFFFSAFLLEPGQSVMGTWGESPNNDVKVCTSRSCEVMILPGMFHEHPIVAKLFLHVNHVIADWVFPFIADYSSRKMAASTSRIPNRRFSMTSDPSTARSGQRSSFRSRARSRQQH